MPARPVSGWWQLAVAALLPLNLELLLSLVAPAGALAERREELYGFLSLLALLLVLLTRRLAWLRPYRRALGLAAFVYGVYHGWLAVQHVLQGDPSNLLFLNQATQASYWAGIVALAGLLPLALTSFSGLQRRMGRGWKRLHRAGPWLTLLSALHTAWAGVHFGFTPFKWTSAALLAVSLAMFFLRRKPTSTPFPQELT
ncbi:ferric reductase-like transmembrane domain-containing protein [Deinococcus altitudinis]|uniref:ferric reductase-like transmembrane domain-containing protein n=1 Tax=Deinococcus altitudinis TaxID=468914 RepID=UPI0038927839